MLVFCSLMFFFFKQKTAYEMRISDWSSDVCSSDLTGRPILAIDPAAARAALEALPWVAAASVERQLPGTVYIRLTEREPLALWQDQGVIQVIDRDGAVIPGVEPRRFAHLPLVVGPDAPAHAERLIAVMDSEPSRSEE